MIRCDNKQCGNYDERYSNGCRALARTIPKEVCFAKMTKAQVISIEEEIKDILETEVAKTNRRYYKNKKLAKKQGEHKAKEDGKLEEKCEGIVEEGSERKKESRL